MATFDQAVLDACAHEREVSLTTWGRTSGAPRRVTLGKRPRVMFDWTLDFAFPPPLVQLKVGQPAPSGEQG